MTIGTNDKNEKHLKKCFGQIVDENFVFGMSLGEESARY
jgi:hypothetical protein